jgi:hypothetical protein
MRFAILLLLGGCAGILGIEEKKLAADAGDAGTAGDAGADAPGSSASPCTDASAYLYCNDFDSVSNVAETWSWTFLPTTTASLTLDGVFFSSPPRALRLTMPAVNNGQMQLGKDLDPLTQRVEVSFDLRVDLDEVAYRSIPQIGVMQINCRGASQARINYVLGPENKATVRVFLSGSEREVIAMPAVATRTWHRVTVSYDVAQGVTVKHGDTVVAERPAFAAGEPGQTTVIVGAVYLNTPPGTTTVVHQMDNVILKGR